MLLRDVASYSSHLANTNRFLLLGANDDEKMRMLIAPHDGSAPVIKTLSLTFAEARVRLEKEWQRQEKEWQRQEKEWQKQEKHWRRLQVEPHDQDLEDTVEIRR